MIEAIRKVDIDSIDYVLDTAMKRKRELYPDWELFYCAAEKSKINSADDLVREAWEFEQKIKRKYG